jgi:hypothetical protein
MRGLPVEFQMAQVFVPYSSPLAGLGGLTIDLAA